MQFLCVCYYDAAALAKFSPEDFATLAARCAPHDKAFKESGKVRFVGSLVEPPQFKTLRTRGKSVQLVDGPYTSTKEPFGAFFLVEADDIDEAVAVARLHPGTHVADMLGGAIEVRPCESFEELSDT